MSNPSDRKYTSSHEWVLVDGDVATVGITHYAQDALGEVIFVDLPEVGDDVEAKAGCAEVESTKAVSDVYSPLTGEIVAINEDLDGAEGTVNSDPFGGGWMFKVRFSDAGELDGLMDAAGYEAHLAAQ